MNKLGLIHDGVSIKVYDTDEPGTAIIHFTDDITAYYKIKKAVINGKGVVCNNIACITSKAVQDGGVPTYFIRQLSDDEQLCHKVKLIPLEVIVRNVVAGSLAQRLGLEEGLIPSEPMYDLCYKSEELADPLINDYHALALGIATREELDQIYSMTKRINAILVPLFDKAGIILVDYKIEFGRTEDGTIMMSDDITPDNARFWDKQTKKRLDKDRFRRDYGHVGESYREVMDRLHKAVYGV